MRTHPNPIRFGLIGSALMLAGLSTAYAAQGLYYDPSNAASPTGKTIGYELNRTIGCPGKELSGTPCPVPPEDSDGDGVIDSKDKCPGTPKGRKVNEDGCELDSDGDGIVDGDDKCPDVYAKTADGCPAAAAALAPVAPAAPPRQKLVLENVNFDYDKATLRADETAVLDEAVATLNTWGNIKVEVAGHADSRGSDAYNQTLSLRRAESVRSYLVGKGIAAERLNTVGYGEREPIADNGTPEGRFKNRRVELLPKE
jgi:OOP family OmpA-OmpF porin